MTHNKVLGSMFATALFLRGAFAQAPGDGISKSTYACDDPIAGMNFMLTYFPTQSPADECDNNVCECSGDGGWDIQQGRLFALTSLTSTACYVQPGCGFGLHLVNVSGSRTTGGMDVSEVEAKITTKLSDMSSRFDSFLDHNVMFYTTGLAAYKATFDKDDVPTHMTTWTYEDETWTSLFVHVPNSQLTIELIQNTTLTSASLGAVDHHPISRVSSHTVRRLKDEGLMTALAPVSQSLRAALFASTDTSKWGAIISPLAVNRAVSQEKVGDVVDFYATGFGVPKSSDTTADGVRRVCFLWDGATVDVCFYARADSMTNGDFKVGDYEDTLNAVHTKIIDASPFCARDKWTDNHYAIDSHSMDTSAIVSYINSNSVHHTCTSSGSMGYACDPTGWCIQLDLSFSSAPSDCSTTTSTDSFLDLLKSGIQALSQRLDLNRRGLGTYNPACDDGTCTDV